MWKPRLFGEAQGVQGPAAPAAVAFLVAGKTHQLPTRTLQSENGLDVVAEGYSTWRRGILRGLHGLLVGCCQRRPC